MIDNIRGALGISCVEIYLLALLKHHGTDERVLYSDSYIGIKETLDDFISGKEKYASYLGKPRLQSVAKDRGLIYFLTYRYNAGNTDFDYNLFEVKPGYKNSGLQAWRDDHYLLRFNNEFYDCYPPSKVENVTEKHLTGTCIGILMNRLNMPLSLEREKEKLMESVKPSQEITLNITADNLPYIRDALLYVKIMRQRMNAVFECPAIEKQIKAIGKLVSLLEIYRLRNRIGEYGELVKEINTTEELWKKKILKK